MLPMKNTNDLFKKKFVWHSDIDIKWTQSVDCLILDLHYVLTYNFFCRCTSAVDSYYNRFKKTANFPTFRM